jgi:hypothetical protein
MTSKLPEIVVAGHPFANVGMGDQMRSSVSALKAANIEHKVFDVFRYAARVDPDHRELIDSIETSELGNGIRIFHINGNEVEPVLKHLSAAGHDVDGGYNVIVPAWELPHYPKPWLELVRKFDEVWAISRFVQEMFARSGIEAHHVSENIELPLRPLLPRRYFGIRESAFVLLNFFDLTSYSQRKNPEAAVALFERLRSARPYDDIQLVLKVKEGDKQADDWLVPVLKYAADTLVLRKPLSTYETHSLIAACDCLVSLHRSEGFGRGTGEAMFLGRLAMATGWSGNLDYMTERNSLLVNSSLVPVKPDAYPFAEGQYWAEPDLDHATHLLTSVLNDPATGRCVAARGRSEVRTLVCARPVGLNMAARLRIITSTLERTHHIARPQSRRTKSKKSRT